MEQSKIKLFLEYLISLNTNEAVDKTDVKLIEAQRELEVLKQNKEIISHRVPKIEEHVKILDETINQSTVYGKIKSAKKRAESTGIHVCKDIESSLKEIRAQQSSVYTLGREIRQKVEDNCNGNTAELLERSRKAGIALAHDNPDITDLSDPNRPTKIAERWSELYDNEWTDAFDDEVRSRPVDEKEIIVDLLEVVKSAYQVCAEKAADEFKEKLPEAVDDRNYFRKTEAHNRIPGLQEFLNVSKAKLVKHGPKAKSMEFIKKCVELCWWMCIQENPVHMYQVDDKKSNADFYRAYTKSGSQLDYLVWPALRLYKDGPLLYRGVAQFK